MFEPRTWDPSIQRYTGNRFSSHVSSYTPKNAYVADGAPGSTGFCEAYNQNIGPNFCKGIERSECSSITDVETYKRCSYEHDDIWEGANYISPMKGTCQANHIIFVSDGRPFNIGTPDGFEEITGTDSLDCVDRRLISTDPNAWKGNCGPELADYISKNDLISSIPGSTVTVNTVAFGLTGNAVEFLADVAEAGEGQFYNSQTSTELHSDLNALFESVTRSNQSFSTFSISVDRATASHDARMYLPMIQPNNSKVWEGNLKGYFLDNEGIKDVDGEIATKLTDSGVQLKESARSFWTDTPDGGSATIGGASAQFDGDTRNLYTYLGSTTTLSSFGVDLSVGQNNRLDIENSSLVPGLFNDTPDLEFLLNYTRFSPMADPLHSDVVIADYADDQRVVFTATNQGFLHAIDATYPKPGTYGDTKGGEEIFAFIPKELLPNLHYSMIRDHPGEHLYGLDGNVVPWHTDINGDGIVNGDDQLILVIGMRRGGKNYYALDVTDPDHPRYLWQIEGGKGDFAKLAQTWSRPSLITVNRFDKSERVLVFGGGYDDSLDDLQEAQPSTGNSIFFVDRNGQLIRAVSHSNMKYAIPSDLAVIDTDGNGLADRIYVGDLNGQIFRISFDDLSTGLEVELFAELADDDYRPFFYPPSVSNSVRPNKPDLLGLLIGSGNRDNPVTDLNEGMIFMLEDNRDLAGNSVDLPLSLNDLYFANDALLQSTDATVRKEERAKRDDLSGWFLSLESGEKVLANALSFEGAGFVTVYKALPNSDVCAIPEAQNRILSVNLFDAGPTDFLGANEDSADTGPVHDDRFTELNVQGIANEPQVVFTANSDDAKLFVGKENVGELEIKLKNILWYGK